MVIIQEWGVVECRGEVICKGKTLKDALKTFRKTDDVLELVEDGQTETIEGDIIYYGHEDCPKANSFKIVYS